MNPSQLFIERPVTTILLMLGILVFGIAFKVVDTLTPYHLWRQLVEEKNVALAIVVGSMALSIAVIIAAAIL